MDTQPKRAGSRINDAIRLSAFRFQLLRFATHSTGTKLRLKNALGQVDKCSGAHSAPFLPFSRQRMQHNWASIMRKID